MGTQILSIFVASALRRKLHKSFGSFMVDAMLISTSRLIPKTWQVVLIVLQLLTIDTIFSSSGI